MVLISLSLIPINRTSSLIKVNDLPRINISNTKGVIHIPVVLPPLDVSGLKGLVCCCTGSFLGQVDSLFSSADLRRRIDLVVWIVRIHFVEEGINLGMGCLWERYTVEREQYQIVSLYFAD